MTSINQQFIRIREESRQHVQPRDFWTAVGAVVVLLGTMGIYVLKTGHAPVIPSCLWLGLLLVMWGSVLINILRYGRRVYSSGHGIAFFCFSLFAISQMIPLLHKSFWVENASVLILLVGNFWTVGNPRDQPASMPPVDPPMHSTS